jgi:monovalent cation:H+ antiporter-2, CPA2 family
VITVAALIAAAALALFATSRFRVPLPVAGILAGLALEGGGLPVDSHLVLDALFLSATFLVFSVGAELDRRHGAIYRNRARFLVLIHLVLTALAVLAVAIPFALDGWTVFYLIIGFSGSSTLLVLEVLRRRERFFEPTGRLVTTVALSQDLLAIGALGAVSYGVDDPVSVATALAAMAAFGVAAALYSRWVVPFILLRSKLGEEERLLFALATLFAFVGAADQAGLPLVLGAYVAGMSLSRFPESGVLRSYVVSFSDFFTIIFSVTLGAVVVLPRPVELLTEAVLVVALLVLRPLLLLPLVKRAGLTVRASVESAALLSQSGEVALIVALVGLERGHIGPDTLGIMAVIAVVTMSAVPWLSSNRVVLRLTHWYPFRGRKEPPIDCRGHIVLLGCGEAGRILVDRLTARGERVVVVDDDPAVIESLRRQSITALRGDGAELDVLENAGAKDALAIVSTMRRMVDNLNLLTRFRGPHILVRVFSESEANKLRQAGAHPIVEAEIASEAILRWVLREPE